MSDWNEEEEMAEILAEVRREEEELTPAGIAGSNRHLLERQRRFRRAADVATAALMPFEEVVAVSLFGSVAGSLWKEVPRFHNYQRARIALWHECKDVDLAVWVSRLDRLRPMRQAVNRALPVIYEEIGYGVAPHEVELFLFESDTDRYLGRLCKFKRCPAQKRECLAPGCGATPFLQQHAGFRLYRDALAPDRTVRLFDRASGQLRRAVNLPTQEGE